MVEGAEDQRSTGATEGTDVPNVLVKPKIHHSPSCRSKPLRHLFIFETLMLIFLEKFLPLHFTVYATSTFKPQKGSKGIIKSNHVTLVV